MTYEQLVVLQAIVTTGTFRAAAEHLNKSQSAVSHMLKKLEDEIDIVLLSREEYRPKLTASGEVFYRHATRVLQQMQHLGGVVKNLNAKQEPEVFLAVTATYPLKPLLDVIREATDVYPATHIRLSRESMSGPIEQLLRGDANLIVATMDGVPMDQVEALPFSTVTIIPVAHPEYISAQNKGVNSISEMQSYVQVVVADSGSGKQPQSRDLLPGGLRWTVSDFTAKKDIILAKMGWGGLPEYLIRDEIDRGELVPLNVEGYPPRQSHLLQMRSRNRDTGIVAQFIWERLMSFSGQIP